MAMESGICCLKGGGVFWEKGHGVCPAAPETGFVLFMFLLVVFGALVILPVSGYTTTDSITAAGRVYVSNITIDPAVLFTGDTATVTFAVTNGNTNTGNTTDGVMFNHATFGDNDIRLTSGSYDSSSNVGPLQTRTYVFNVMTDKLDGTVLPDVLSSFPGCGQPVLPYSGQG